MNNRADQIRIKRFLIRSILANASRERRPLTDDELIEVTFYRDFITRQTIYIKVGI